MIACPSCGRHILEATPCPFCSPARRRPGRLTRSVAAICSMWLVACYGPPPGYKDAHKSGADRDGDGYDSSVDCNDGDPAINPGATEICGNKVDDDCDGKTDALDEACGKK